MGVIISGPKDKQEYYKAEAEKLRRQADEVERYGKKAQEKVRKAVKKYKRGKLKSSRSGKIVKSRKQAIAIGLSEARLAGGKVSVQTRR